MNPQPLIQRILVPHDFSETADYALAYAFALAQKFNARVTAVHVCDVAPYGYPDAYFGGFEDFALQVEQAAAEALAQVATVARSSGHELETVVRRGVAWHVIDALVNEMKVDLVVMGTEGRKGVSRLLLGSVAEKVVRTAACPVLTVRLPQADRGVGGVATGES